jgi:hypothetical protein
MEGQRVMVFASLALMIYLIGFNLFELGMMKVPVLLSLFGLFIASPFFSHLGTRASASLPNRT